MTKFIEYEAHLAHCRTERETMREAHFKAASPTIGHEAVDELRQFYQLYDERLYIWRASLWEPVIGGFYFSTSWRDTAGFLPDIESTVQALICIRDSGLSGGRSYIEAASPDMRAALSRFVHSLLDTEDGYFYYPQWGKGITLRDAVGIFAGRWSFFTACGRYRHTLRQ